MGANWSQEVACIMSNIPEGAKTEFSLFKLDIEKIARDNDIKQIDLDSFLKFKIDVNRLYSNPLRGQFTHHFKEATKVEFNPQAE